MGFLSGGKTKEEKERKQGERNAMLEEAGTIGANTPSAGSRWLPTRRGKAAVASGRVESAE